MIDNKQIQQINVLLKKQLVQRYGVMALAFVVIGSIAAFGTNMQKGSHAAALPATLSLSPATATVTAGTNVSFTINEDSSTDTVNSVQASLIYDPSQLQYVSMSEGTAFPVVAANSTATPGTIRVARGTTAPSTVTGSKNLVTLTFKALASTGTGAVSFDPAFSYIVRSTDNVNVLASTSSLKLTYKLPAPAITTVLPLTGSTSGGTNVTITGSNFVNGATVKLGGVPATNVVFVNATTLTATTGAHAAGVVDVTVTNPDLQSVPTAGSFTYLANSPTVSNVSPATGTTAGGTTVTITGTGFVSGATVTFGGIAATNIVFVSPTALTATTPAHAVGAAAVVINNPTPQSAPAVSSFMYQIPAPSFTAVSPAVGSLLGGTAVTLTGSNFAGITSVTFGGIVATSVVTVNPSTITAVTPAHAAGLVNVVITNTTGSATKAGAFTYHAAAPTVTSVSPNVGTSNGGTRVTITGTGFASGATVIIGNNAATNVTYINATTLTVTAPAGAATFGTKAGAFVEVINPDSQTGILPGAYTYLAPGDANNDGRVNAIDLSILISHDAQNYPPADFNGDGTVGAADMAILLGRWTW